MFTIHKGILRLVVPENDKFICPECGGHYDPMHRFCVHCGARLPEPDLGKRDLNHEPHGLDRGVEPDPNNLQEEPSYDGGGAAGYKTSVKTDHKLPKYRGEDTDEREKEKPESFRQVRPAKPASGCLIGLMIIISLIVPPVGIVNLIIWAFLKPYRKAILPAFLATIIGVILWGWMMWGTIRAGMLEEAYNVLDQYLVAQAEANSGTGHYMSLLELERHGYLKTDFPGETETEFEIIEHVLGPTGFIVEIRPGNEESDFFKLDSLWADHTGDVRVGSRDGPRYNP